MHDQSVEQTARDSACLPPSAEVEPDKLATVRATIAKGSRSLAKDA